MLNLNFTPNHLDERNAENPSYYVHSDVVMKLILESFADASEFLWEGCRAAPASIRLSKHQTWVQHWWQEEEQQYQEEEEDSRHQHLLLRVFPCPLQAAVVLPRTLPRSCNSCKFTTRTRPTVDVKACWVPLRIDERSQSAIFQVSFRDTKKPLKIERSRGWLVIGCNPRQAE